MKTGLIVVLSGILIGGVCFAGKFAYDGLPSMEDYPVNSSDESLTSDDSEMELLTDVQLILEGAWANGGDYRFKGNRGLEFDILRVGDMYIHFGVQEESLFEYSPSQLDHSIEYFGIGYETGAGRWNFFWDHRCNNASREQAESRRNDIHWNELGVGYETTGMRLGHKDDGIVFDDGDEWLGKFDWRVGVSKVWMRRDCDYDFMFKTHLRNDFYRAGNNVFYFQCGADSIYDDRGFSFNTHLEIGDRIRIGRNVSFGPFAAYQHFHDWYDPGTGEEIFLAGVRMEIDLEPKGVRRYAIEDGGRERKRAIEGLSEDELPRFRLDGGYNENISGDNDGCRSSDLGIDLDLLRLDGDKMLTLNTYAGLLTFTGKFDIQNVNYKVGPSLSGEGEDFDWRVYHSYSCLYGIADSGLMRSYNLLGMEIGRDEQLRWSLGGGVYATSHNVDYSGDLTASAGYDFLGNEGMIPYVEGAVHALVGGDDEAGYSIETGLKFPGKEGDFSVYLRWQDDYDTFRFGEGRQVWGGFKFAF